MRTRGFEAFTSTSQFILDITSIQLSFQFNNCILLSFIPNTRPLVEAKAVIKESKEDKSGNSPIYVQYIYKQKSALFYTGLKVSKKFWNKKSTKIKFNKKHKSK